MADEKKTVVKENAGESRFSKFLAFFKNLPNRIATVFKNMWHELKKVTWPTKQDLIKYSCIVLLFMAFMGIVIGLLDMGASRLVTAVSSLKSTDEAEEAVSEAVEDAGLPADTDTVQDAVNEAAEAAENAAEAVQEEAAESAEAAEEAAAPAAGN